MSGQATRVLFDTPGPRGRRRIVAASVVVVLLTALALALAVRQLAVNGQLAPHMWSFLGYSAILAHLGHGLVGTFLATGVSAVVAFPLGLLLALGRLSPVRTVAWLATGWIEFFRSVPMLLVVYAFLLALPRFGVVLPVLWMLVVPMILVGSASMAEVFRAGVLAVERGQWEAAASLGLLPRSTMRLVVLPQALRIVLPNLLTGLVSLLKDSTLGYVVSYPELMQQGKTLASFYGYLIQTYLVIAVVYVAVNYGLTRLAARLQARGSLKAASTRPATADVEPQLA